MKADLHDEIMRIAAKPDQEWNGGEQHAYKLGHRDARHAAAELALAASGGNAAPDGIKRYSFDPYGMREDLQGGWLQRAEVLAAASAPNAALVAASKQALQYLSAVAKRTGSNEVWERCESICGDLRAALSAAGQEAGK